MRHWRAYHREPAIAGLGLLVAAAIGCEMFELDPAAGPAPPPAGITGGTPTDYESWQGVVGVVWIVDGWGPVACSGSLIAPDVVLTAGHCVWNAAAEQDFRTTPEEYEIRGGPDVYTDGGWFHLSGVAEAVVHPDWDGWLDPESPATSVDIGMLRLTEPVTGIEHYALRQPPAPAVGTGATIVGYGNSVDGDVSTQGVHRMGATTVLEVTETFIELGDPSGLCHGDSGGGMFTEQGGEQVLTGINSWGAGGVCNPLEQTYATNVASYLDFIEGVLSVWSADPEPDAGVDGGDADADTDGDTDADGDSDADDDDEHDDDDDPTQERDDSCSCAAPGRVAPGGLVWLLAALAHAPGR